ncbi:MAG: hypothetical protein U0359_26850 [Byssovorax sp.]
MIRRAALSRTLYVVLSALSACSSANKGSTPPPPPPPPPVAPSCAHPSYQSRACWTSGTPAVIDLQLYTTGLNHHENDPKHNVVDQDGVRALADFIRADAIDPDKIVVALSASMVKSCEAGDKNNPLAPVYNGQCLAHELEQRFGRHYDLIEANPEDTHWGGPALIVGSHWKALANEHLRVDGEDALRVDLADPEQRSFSMFVMHTKGNEDMPAEMAALASFALDRPMLSNRDRYLRPLFVGDYNVPTCSINDPTQCTASVRESRDQTARDALVFMEDHFDFLDEALACPAQDGRAAITFRFEDDLMHVLSGKGSGPFDFSCADGELHIVRVGYSTDDGSRAVCPDSGVKIRGMNHNVLSLGLQIVDKRPVRCGAGARCRRAACAPAPTPGTHGGDQPCDTPACCESGCDRALDECMKVCPSMGSGGCQRCQRVSATCHRNCAQH